MTMNMRSPMHAPSNRRFAAGFTLIELMITVAVIAVLAAVALPSYQRHVLKTNRALAKADLVEIAQLLERYHTVQNSYDGFSLPFNQSPRQGNKRYTLSLNGKATASTYTLQAVPETGQDKDVCGTLTLDQAGRKTPDKKTNAECW